MLLPMLISLVFQVFPPQERGAALGFFAIPIVAGPALGPTLGGQIIADWDWRLVFFINLPVGIVATPLGDVPPASECAAQRSTIRRMGFLLSSLAFGCTLYGLSQVGSHGWSSLEVHRLREARINTLRNSMIEMLQEYGIVWPDISPQVGFFLTDPLFPEDQPDLERKADLLATTIKGRLRTERQRARSARASASAHNSPSVRAHRQLGGKKDTRCSHLAWLKRPG
jgi:hypothetical protein